MFILYQELAFLKGKKLRHLTVFSEIYNNRVITFTIQDCDFL